MEMSEIHKAVAGDKGGDPFEAQNAAAREYHRAHPPETAAPAAPKKLSWLSKVGNIFAKGREEAKAKYLRLLKKAEIDGRDLSDRETAEQAAAMKEAEISKDDAEEHCTRLQKLAEAAQAAAKLPVLLAAMQDAGAALDAHDRKVREMAVQRIALAAANEDAATNYRFAQLAAAPLPGLVDWRRELFGE